MEIRFVVPDLRALDALRGDAIVVSLFEDERPLRGATGLLDWRLCGRLSRLLLRGRVRGSRGERVLVPGRPRLPVDKLFLFGLGLRTSFDEGVFRDAIRDIIETLDGVGARTVLLALPGRSIELVPPDRALELFLEVASSGPSPPELVVIETADAQRAMLPVLERARRRARALGGGIG